MSASVMQVRCTATLHRSLVNPTLRPRTLYGRPGRRTLAVPLQARKTETSNNNSKDITETGGKVSYDKSATEVDLLQPAFTRRREVFVGRLAMVGFVSAVLGELFTGRGVLGQVGLYTGLSRPAVQALVVGIVSFNYLAAVNPRSPTWSFENQKDVRKRPSGPIQDPKKNAVSDPQGFLGISKAFGFTKQNEVFVGRIAMIGFAAAIVGEIQTGGKGPLGQLALPIQTPVNPGLAGFGLAVWVGFSLFTAIGLGNLGQAQGGEDIY
ncbi:hypothetical protein ABBQ32_003219 [Trebouxia sp. C0010 RCD-2024]